MKLDRRTVLSGTAAAFAAPFLGSQPARADGKRQPVTGTVRGEEVTITAGRREYRGRFTGGRLELR